MLKRAITRWQSRARCLKRETYALYLALKDPRTPWYARLLAAVVVGYAFSPIDLIPDFIPILGYLDDLVIVPFGIALTIRLVPTEVLSDARARAEQITAGGHPASRLASRSASRSAAAVVILIWLLLAAFVLAVVLRYITRPVRLSGTP